MSAFKDLSGQRFGRLTADAVVRVTLSSGRSLLAYKCRCDCGGATQVLACHLSSGKTRSCGCASAEMHARKRAMGRVIEHPAYGVYSAMLRRCYNRNAWNFPWYGEKGVAVCDRWRFGSCGMTGFQCFMADMGERPGDKTVDRIDPFGHYTPDNCRWADRATQAANKRRSSRLALE